MQSPNCRLCAVRIPILPEPAAMIIATRVTVWRGCCEVDYRVTDDAHASPYPENLYAETTP